MSEPQIVSASRRTDIPGFHARWFLARLRAGSCAWVHPYTSVVREVSLRPDDVLAFVFWTRHPGPLLPHLDALVADGTPMLFQFTINGYGPPLETHNPAEATALRHAETIARRLGEHAVLWRFDPIVLSRELTPAWHVARFRRLAERLQGVTRRCTISFVDLYGKTRRNLAPLEEAQGFPFDVPDEAGKRALAAELAAIANAYGMELVSCCDDSLVHGAVGKSRCVDPAAVATASVAAGRVAELPKLRAAPTRKDCGCVRSVDIGAYDTCAFGCRYCYAVRGRGTALARLRETDPADPLLWRPPSLRGEPVPSASGGSGSGVPGAPNPVRTGPHGNS
jgi:Domain of unknown function (DUF1848)